MNLAHLTAAVIIADSLVLIGYDVWVKLKQPDGNATISWVTLTAAKRAPMFAVAAGILTGHLFWQNCP